MATDIKEFKEKAIGLIRLNFGDYTAKLYNTSFDNKNKEEILDFMNKLLSEFVGPDNATKQLSKLK